MDGLSSHDREILRKRFAAYDRHKIIYLVAFALGVLVLPVLLMHGLEQLGIATDWLTPFFIGWVMLGLLAALLVWAPMTVYILTRRYHLRCVKCGQPLDKSTLRRHDPESRPDGTLPKQCPYCRIPLADAVSKEARTIAPSKPRKRMWRWIFDVVLLVAGLMILFPWSYKPRESLEEVVGTVRQREFFGRRRGRSGTLYLKIQDGADEESVTADPDMMTYLHPIQVGDDVELLVDNRDAVEIIVNGEVMCSYEAYQQVHTAGNRFVGWIVIGYCCLSMGTSLFCR